MQSNILGENIKAARKRKRYSAEKLGELLDPPVTYAAVYAWEKGKNEPSVAYVLQICNQWVAGSIPVTGSIISAGQKPILACFSFALNSKITLNSPMFPCALVPLGTA